MTTTYDPIVTTTQLEPRRGIGATRPRSRGGTVQVLYKRGGEPVVLRAGERLTLGESMFGGFTQAYDVDVSEHRLDLRQPLPCHGGVHSFAATFGLTCWVTDPVMVVERNVRDVGRVLADAIFEHARPVSIDYLSGDTHSAEQAVRSLLQRVTLHPAFATTLTRVQFEPDEQVVRLGRRTAETNYNEKDLNLSRLAAAYLEKNPGDIAGALEIERRELQQLEEVAGAHEQAGGRARAALREATRAAIERQGGRYSGKDPAGGELDGVRPVLMPREATDKDDDDDEDA